MVTVELAELAIDLRLKYKLDTELQWDKKYPLIVFRSRQATTVNVKYDALLKTYDVAVIKAHPTENILIDDYTTYDKHLSRNDLVVKIVKVLGL